MGVQTYSAQQRRAVNLIWAAAGEYGFEPKFLAMKTDGTPDFYMNFVIGLVYKWFGLDMLERLFDSWLGDVRQAVMDDLAWLALESTVYQKELPGRPALEELRQDHAREFFAMEYQTSRQEWMARNQLVYSMQAARWKNVLGKPTRLVTPWDKGLYRALCCGDVSGEELEQALRACFRKYLGFDGKVRTKAELRLHFDNRRWIAFMTKMAPTELVRTDDLAIGRAAHAGQAGFVRAADALRSMLRSNERAEADRAYIQRCFGRSMYAPKQLSAIEQQRCTGNHLGCRLWFTRGDPAADVPPSSDSQQLYEQAAEQARLNRAAYAENSELYESALLRLTEQIRNCMLVHQQPEAVTARQAELIRHIRDHLLTDREGYTSLSRLSAEHEMSVSHLQKLFKQIYGVPVYHYIKEYRLEQAAVELVRSARPVTEIAQDAGYDNASKFSACFKERYGVTPSQYRTDAKAKQSIGTKTE